MSGMNFPKNPDDGQPHLDWEWSEAQQRWKLIQGANVTTVNGKSGDVEIKTGVVASVKFNGSEIKYSQGVSEVIPLGNTGYDVKFDSDIAEFDEHFAVQITPFVSQSNLPNVVTLTGFSASSVQFTVTEINNGVNQAPSAPVGFSLLVVDMEQS